MPSVIELTVSEKRNISDVFQKYGAKDYVWLETNSQDRKVQSESGFFERIASFFKNIARMVEGGDVDFNLNAKSRGDTRNKLWRNAAGQQLLVVEAALPVLKKIDRQASVFADQRDRAFIRSEQDEARKGLRDLFKEATELKPLYTVQNSIYNDYKLDFK